jgi:hypothetical protein
MKTLTIKAIRVMDDFTIDIALYGYSTGYFRVKEI